MVEYYKTNGGYFYKKKKNGEVTRVSSEVYKRNVMKGGAGADGGGGGGGDGGDDGGSGGVKIESMMNNMTKSLVSGWRNYPIDRYCSSKNYRNVADLYKKYRVEELPIIMEGSIDNIEDAYFKCPVFYGSPSNVERRKEFWSHRKIMDLGLIFYLIKIYDEHPEILDSHHLKTELIVSDYTRNYIRRFIKFYTKIFNLIEPGFIEKINLYFNFYDIMNEHRKKIQKKKEIESTLNEYDKQFKENNFKKEKILINQCKSTLYDFYLTFNPNKKQQLANKVTPLFAKYTKQQNKIHEYKLLLDKLYEDDITKRQELENRIERLSREYEKILLY